jgi:hypothetical protein
MSFGTLSGGSLDVMGSNQFIGCDELMGRAGPICPIMFWSCYRTDRKRVTAGESCEVVVPGIFSSPTLLGVTIRPTYRVR